jgi:hypothetical protein
VIIFGFYQKNNQTEIILKKLKPNRNRVKPTGFGSVWFFREKTGSNRFGSVFPVFSVLALFFRFGSVLRFGSILARFFQFSSVLARFFSGLFFVSVRFSFFDFLLIKLKPNQPVFLKF